MLDPPLIVAALYSAIITVCMALTAFLCLCGCRAKERKDELVGIEGHVKMTNPDNLEIHDVPSANVNGEVATSVKRSLPDLPVDHPAAGNEISWEPGGDTTSELYATVGADKPPKVERSKEHPYDKLKSVVEHPYAQVHAVDAPSTSANPPEGLSSARLPPAPREIAAASAIAGQVHASDDLPYMTPPTHFSGDSQDSAKGYTSISVREPLAAIRAETTEVQIEERRNPHYMTVSDDSDDMYAAIDEPASGSETYAQIHPAVVTQPEAPSDNYSQLKPGSAGEVLRAVSSPAHNISHSRQESSSSATSTVNSPKPEKREANSPLPAPPGTAHSSEDRNLDDMYAKVNKKKRRDVEEVLERGASTESAISGSSESVSYRLQSNNISVTDTSQSDSCHGQSTTCSSTSEPVPSGSSISTHSCHSHSTGESPSPRRTEVRSNSSLSSDAEIKGSYERLTDDPRYETLNKKIYETLNKKDPGYETIHKAEPGYQTLGDDKDPEYETLGGNLSDPCYATLKKTHDPGYEKLNNNVISDIEPNYETLGRGPPSDSDPNYEQIGKANHDYASLPAGGYASVSKASEKVDEPPYSSVRGDVYAAVVKPKQRKAKDPPYATIASDGCDLNGHLDVSEPPYASLLGDFASEPEYESMQFKIEDCDPPYQLLADFESGNGIQNKES